MKEQLKKADLPGLFIVAAALMTYWVNGVWNYWHWIAVGVGGLLILISLALKFGDIRTALQRRSSRYGVNSATSVLLFVGILGLVNYLGAQHLKRLDMTSEGINSLSEQSIQVAGQVKEDVRIKAFYSGGDNGPVRDLLTMYTSQNRKIAFEFVDPDKQPGVARQYEVTEYGDKSNPGTGTLILEMGDKKERIESQTPASLEESVTNGLTKLIKGEKKTIYFMAGHGEHALDGKEAKGYSMANDALAKENYTVKTLNLVSEGMVPEDATAVIIAGPKSEPFPNELDMLDAYLKNGGGVMALVDPSPSPSLKDFLKQWSIDVGDNLVVDASGLGKLFNAGPEIPLVTNYDEHRITKPLVGTMTFFPQVRSVAPVQPPVEGVTAEALFSSNPQSWGETDMKSPELAFDPKTDLRGPVPLAVAATKDQGENKKSRLVVFGDSDFAANSNFNQVGDGNLFLNSVAWLAQDENFISIRPKTSGDRPLTMTEANGRMVYYVTVFLLPGSILIGGVYMWMRRRK